MTYRAKSNNVIFIKTAYN